ncbi:MAG: glycosyltransferase family 2 protein [Pseudomonadota bacterium]
MQISVALCTYNGERFLQAQLDSLACQTRLPDELVVCDDGSSDRTLDILTRFAERAPFPVQIHRNACNLGPVDNFFQAASLCRGDYVAFCDQDDVWREDKLARCAAAFADPDVLLVMHPAEVVDSQLQPLGRIMAVPKPGVRARLASPLWFTAFGISMVFAAWLAQRIDWHGRPPDRHNKDAPPMGHDGWIYVLANVLGKIAYLPEPLVRYRQHDANDTGAPAASGKVALQRALMAGYAQQQWLADVAACYVASMEGLARQHPGPLGERFLEGAAAYRDMWRRLAARAELYRPDLGAARKAARLLRLAGSGGYGARDRGGLGARSLLKDTAFIMLGHAH